jgi:hypothetical protein
VTALDASPGPASESSPAAGSGWSWRTYWASLAVFSVLLGLWGLATPRFAVPDEPAHFVKAAAVARGQLIGPPERPTRFHLPPGIVDARFQTGCFVFKPEVPADCPPGQGGSGTGSRDVVAYTAAGKYPPAYYALVGLPTLVWPDLRSVHAARGLSAALSAALLAAALTAAAASRRPPASIPVVPRSPRPSPCGAPGPLSHWQPAPLPARWSVPSACPQSCWRSAAPSHRSGWP